MRGAIIHDPEDAIGRAIGLALHHLRHHPTERHDARLGLATPHHIASADIPGGEILQRTATSILVLHPTWSARGGGQAGVTTNPGLDARLLVGADDVVLEAETQALPQPRVEIQDHSRLLGEPRITREDPMLIAPRLDRIAIQDTPDG